MHEWLSQLKEALHRILVEQPPGGGINYHRGIFFTLLIFLGATILIWSARRILSRVEQRVERFHGASYRRKIETITSLIGSTLRYTIYIGALLAMVSVWAPGAVTSLAFGSAFIGAAIGFGSQGLVQDVITGLSILAEDQLAVGDFVEVGGKSGIVEEIGLRVIRLRDHLGVQHVIFNRTISSVSNYTSGSVQALVDVFLEKAEDGEAARQVALKVCQDMHKELPYFPSMPEVEGITQSSTNDTFLRLRISVLPQQQGIISEHFAERLKRALAGAKITVSPGGIRVIIMSDIFKKAIKRTIVNALPTDNQKTYEGAV